MKSSQISGSRSRDQKQNYPLDVTISSLVEVYWCFGGEGTYFLKSIRKFSHKFLYVTSLKTEFLNSFNLTTNVNCCRCHLALRLVLTWQNLNAHFVALRV
jgi:hypothetical protein